ncbi:MAG: NAD-dependent epimerase/dehydratase family protein [Verrucomicrobiota bacterium]|nr:NAD-dependent epimerase/dehydratase family protein [Verrucomicrobiota bacterium]
MQSEGSCGQSGETRNETSDRALPDLIATEEQLDEILTRPCDLLTKAVRQIASPLVIVGAGGKMGPTLAVLAKRAADASGRGIDVVAVSRFGNEQVRRWIENHGVKTVACDLLDSRSVAKLPDSGNLIYLVGLKFGTGTNPSATWAVNTLAPAAVCEKYAGSRIVALSTGNVCPLVPIDSGGSVETDRLTPLREYSNAAVGRERIFEYCAERYGSAWHCFVCFTLPSFVTEWCATSQIGFTGENPCHWPTAGSIAYGRATRTMQFFAPWS